MALMGFLGVTVYHTALNYGELTVTAGTASFLINTAPIFTALLATIFLHERLKFWGWAGIVISFAGVAVIALGEGHGLQVISGALLILLSAICASFYMILQKNLLRRYTAIEVTACSVWFGTIGLLFFAPGLVKAVLSAPPSATLSAVYLGIFPTALAYVTWAYALSRLTASRTISFIYLMPALTVLSAWLWLGEVPPPASFLGGLIALAGVVLVNLRGK
jgi:drug/metabolite transporter (DMT)-like permease